MNIADIFSTNNAAFTTATLTDAITKLPHKPNRIEGLGLFQTKGVPTTTVFLEERAGRLVLLSNKVRGEPEHEHGGLGRRKMRNFQTLHLPLHGVVLADELQNLRAFGSTELATATSVVADKLSAMRDDIEVTIEHLRLGALKGLILDADGATVLYDLFSEFGETQTVVSFDLDETNTSVRLKCLEVKRDIELALGAANFDHIHALCGKTFFDDLIEHADTKAAFDRFLEGERLRDDPRAGFSFAGVIFEEYAGSIDGVNFIDDEEAVIFPVGVPGLFMDYRAPADFIETANTIGMDMYARQAVRHDNRGIDLWVQANPLPICTRPKALIKATIADE